MNQLYLHVVIFKKLARLSLTLIAVLFSSIFFNGLPAFAQDDYDITGHYYLANPQKPGKYYDAVQWKITNTNEWTGFVNKLQKLPEGSPIDNPLHLKQPDMIHLVQTNPDKISGNNIYLSKAGIQQFAKMPFDTYHYQNFEIRKFLEAELKKTSAYDNKSEGVKISDPEIVVVYRGSTVLQNPMWRVTDPKTLAMYKKYISSLVPLPDSKKLRLEMKKTAYDNVGTFIIYLNYPGAPYQILCVTAEGGNRGTIVNLKRFFFKDTNDYYSIFKQQAENIIRRDEAKRNGTSLNNTNDNF